MSRRDGLIIRILNDKFRTYFRFLIIYYNAISIRITELEIVKIIIN